MLAANEKPSIKLLLLRSSWVGGIQRLSNDEVKIGKNKKAILNFTNLLFFELRKEKY